MKTMYIREQGAYVRKRSKRLSITKGQDTIFEKPILNIDEVVLFGNIQISTQAFRLLLDKGIDIIFLTKYGKYVGHAQSKFSKNIFLRLAQFKKYNNLDFRRKMAKIFVRSKIYNQIQIIKYYLSPEQYQNNLEDIQKYRDSLENKNKINSIRGIEGISSRIYYSQFSKMIKNEMKFRKRKKRPPTDPVNSLLSLGYTFLTNTFTSLLESKSFEVYLGFLHGVKYGRKSLPLDIVEEFRQPVIDCFTLRLINKRMIKINDFEKRDNQGCFLKKPAFNKFCLEYNKYLEKKRTRINSSYNAIFKKQVNNLQKTIMGDSIYKSFRVSL